MRPFDQPLMAMLWKNYRSMNGFPFKPGNMSAEDMSHPRTGRNDETLPKSNMQLMKSTERPLTEISEETNVSWSFDGSKRLANNNMMRAPHPPYSLVMAPLDVSMDEEKSEKGCEGIQRKL
ncbi:hypothetical protein TNCV_3603881 [Trichonephila clavipes]|nr:hypothetical protein TNCV_3603881 [Trichonephila clavipes]